MGVIAGKAKRGHFLGRAMLEFSRDLLIAENCFQSGFLERPNAGVNRRQSAKRVDVLLNNLLGQFYTQKS
jgi:hypothetical protein